MDSINVFDCMLDYHFLKSIELSNYKAYLLGLKAGYTKEEYTELDKLNPKESEAFTNGLLASLGMTLDEYAAEIDRVNNEINSKRRSLKNMALGKVGSAYLDIY